MKFKDYYAILGIERGATPEQIKKTYRRLARQCHPDISKQKGDEERFKEISEAYQTLSDPDKRQAYEQLGRHDPGEEFRPPPEWESRFSRGQAHQELNLSELLEQLGFGGAGRPGQPAGFDVPIRGQDLETVARLSLEEVVRGTQVTLERPGGSVRIRVPQGVVDGERLRIPGRGGPGSGGGPDGDVYLQIQLQPHPLFRPVGHDLYLELPLTPWEAALGARIQLPALEGGVLVTVQPGAHGGQTLRLAGKGLPRRGGGAGDLYAVLQIVMPSEISEREQELYRELARASSFQPRPHFPAGSSDG